MSILLELDPNIVKPGWTPLLILVGLALVMVLLFRSMRRQFRRVDENFPEAGPTPSATDEAAGPAAAAPGEGPSVESPGEDRAPTR